MDKNLSVYDIKIKKLIEEASENPFELKNLRGQAKIYRFINVIDRLTRFYPHTRINFFSLFE